MIYSTQLYGNGAAVVFIPLKTEKGMNTKAMTLVLLRPIRVLVYESQAQDKD
jgi:hypothetical protein